MCLDSVQWIMGHYLSRKWSRPRDDPRICACPSNPLKPINTGTRILCIFELCHGAELLLQPAEEAEAALLRVQELAPDQVTRL